LLTPVGRILLKESNRQSANISAVEGGAAGHYLKRLVAINIQYGDPAFHITRRAEDVFKSASALRQEQATAADRAANAA
jgi:hypothetical protein